MVKSLFLSPEWVLKPMKLMSFNVIITDKRSLCFRPHFLDYSEHSKFSRRSQTNAGQTPL